VRDTRKLSYTAAKVEERMVMTSSTKNPVPGGKVTSDGVTYEVVDPRTLVDIDRDLPWHSGRWPLESWFIVANLDADGQGIGLQVHFSIQHIPTGTDVVELNGIVVNETAGISRTFEYFYPIEQVGLSADHMDISTPELTMRGDRSGVAVRVEGKDTQIDITTTAAAPPVLINGQGQVAFLGVDQQYDFAFPAMPTTGTVVLDQVAYQVTGISWLDRQWGGMPGIFAPMLSDGPPAPGAKGEGAPKVMNWIWANPQLDNGVNVTAGQVRDMINNKIYLPFTAVHPDGTHVVVPCAQPVEASEYWTSPTTGHRNPTRCVFRAPQIDTELVVEVPYKEQEIVSAVDMFTKLEGSATVSGTYQGQSVTGRSYIEIVGNWT
jgi:predicted secreted hydrolase